MGVKINIFVSWPRQTWAISVDTYDRYSDLYVIITSCSYLELKRLLIDSKLKSLRIFSMSEHPFKMHWLFISTREHLYDESILKVPFFLFSGRRDYLRGWPECIDVVSWHQGKHQESLSPLLQSNQGPSTLRCEKTITLNYKVISYLFCLRIAVALCFARGSANQRRVIHITKWNAKWNFMKCLNTR